MAENVAPSDIQRFEPARYLSSGSSFRCFAFALIFLVSSISVYTDNTIVQPRLGDQKNAHKAASLKRNATAALIRSGDTLAYYKGFITRNQAIAALPWASSVDHLVFHEPDLPSSHINHLRVNSGNLSLSFVDVGKTFKSAKRRDAAARRKLVGRPGGKALKGECEPTDLSEQYPLGYKAMCWFWYSQVLSYTHAYDFVLRVDDDCFLHPNSPWPRGNTAPVSSFVSSNAAKYRRPAPLPPPPSSFTLLKLGSTTLASTPLGIAAKQAAKSWVQHVSKGHSLRHSLRGGDDARSTKQLVESETTTVDTPTTRNATITSSSSHSSSSTERNSASASISSASSNISNISSASRGKSEGDLGGGRGWRRARSRKSHSSRRSSSSNSRNQRSGRRTSTHGEWIDDGSLAEKCTPNAPAGSATAKPIANAAEPIVGGTEPKPVATATSASSSASFRQGVGGGGAKRVVEIGCKVLSSGRGRKRSRESGCRCRCWCRCLVRAWSFRSGDRTASKQHPPPCSAVRRNGRRERRGRRRRGREGGGRRRGRRW
mmetsp:Transcript_7091/g.14527  ORF Transcript_7091/g.14527 Transcript_7091/m.14527 type:complete len:544 (+) Transcript_7091:105-1736(+)